MAFFIGPDTDENKCVEIATRRFHSTGKKEWIHKHKFTQTCNDECYLAPKPPKEKETSRAFN